VLAMMRMIDAEFKAGNHHTEQQKTPDCAGVLRVCVPERRAQRQVAA
jgi:hypothetical protein